MSWSGYYIVCETEAGVELHQTPISFPYQEFKFMTFDGPYEVAVGIAKLIARQKKKIFQDRSAFVAP
jgi:hypothetical protein